MSRNVTCLLGGTTQVELHLCQSAATYAVDLKIQERCYAPCRGDCRVSEWSHWSHCHRNCQAADVGRCMVPFILHTSQHRYVVQAVLLYVDISYFDLTVLRFYLDTTLWQPIDISNVPLHFHIETSLCSTLVITLKFFCSETTCSWRDCHFFITHNIFMTEFIFLDNIFWTPIVAFDL